MLAAERGAAANTLAAYARDLAGAEEAIGDLVAADASPTCRVTVQALSRITATFLLNAYPITVTAAPAAGGGWSRSCR